MKQVQHLDAAVQEMYQNGITKKQLRDKYHLTEWGARKFVDTIPVSSITEVDGRGKKMYTGEKPVEKLCKDVKTVPIPVKQNYSEVQRESQHNKAKRTEEARSFIEDIEEKVKQVEMPEIEWREDKTEYGGVDVIMHETDTHLGAVVEDENGETMFDPEYAEDTVYSKYHEFKDYVERQNTKNGVDTIHWLLGGDIVEGTGIYEGQAHEVGMYINEQLEKASEILITCAKAMVKLAEKLDAQLQIVTVPGNHGDMRVKGASNKANFDDIIYHTLALALDTYLENHSHSENVRMKRSDRSVGTTFPVRGHVGYLTHGQNMKEHVGTSSGKKDALSIQNQKGCDAIFRGHYHMSKVEEVNGMPVVMTPSIKPGGPYEDSMQAYADAGYAFYTADDRNAVRDVQYHNTEFVPPKSKELMEKELGLD